jgi:hypothetical protein
MKYGNLTFGQMEALVNILGGDEALRQILSREVEVVLVDSSQTLIDKYGRRIPKNIQNEVVDDDRNYRIFNPEDFYYSVPLGHVDILLKKTGLEPNEFETKSTDLFSKLQADPRLKNLLKGPFLPICIPQIRVNEYGYCHALKEVFLPAVERAYKSMFKGPFYNNLPSEVTEVKIMEESRQEKLIAAMADGPVVGIYFPAALQGFSILAAREQMSSLPEGFVLSGALDIATAIVMYIDILCRDKMTPGLDCAANAWQDRNERMRSFTFYAGGMWSAGKQGCIPIADGVHDNEMAFYRRDLNAISKTSGGLLYLG